MSVSPERRANDPKGGPKCLAKAAHIGLSGDLDHVSLAFSARRTVMVSVPVPSDILKDAARAQAHISLLQRESIDIGPI